MNDKKPVGMREDILTKRYYFKDDEGRPTEDWKGLCRRVAVTIACDPEEEQAFFEVMHSGLFLPNTPALTNAGKKDFSMSACFVIPVEDSMRGIFGAVTNAALVHKMGGGTGFSFSSLRPARDLVGSTKGIASGPCSFMAVFDTATAVTKQGGTRRGANMGMLRVDHPDILAFIDLKREEGVMENFNLSVAITSTFMEALNADKDYELVFGGKVRGKLRARDVWNRIIENAWKNGEPGIVFIDRINEENPTPHLGAIEGTNPCGEQPLLPYEACVLGSVNLSVMVSEGEIQWDLLKNTVATGVKLLDNIIDVQAYPLEEIEQMHKTNRKIGLGVMGWADMLIKLGLHYASEEAIALAEKVMAFINLASIEASSALAETRGVFPGWVGSFWYERGAPMRNATTTTIAPTGSISIIADCSGGIEPVFDFETIQRRAEGEHSVLHPLAEAWMRESGTKELPNFFVKASDVPVEWHIRMQAAFQKHVQNAVSKTINLPRQATQQDVENAFLLSYQLGCKGVTVYRDGSRSQQVISSKSEGGSVAVSGLQELTVPKKIALNAVESSRRVAVDTKDGRVYIHITMVEYGGKHRPVEVFAITPVGGQNREVYDALCRSLSTALRYGVPVQDLLKQLEDANADHGHASSIPNAILRSFRLIGINGSDPEACPDCGGIVTMEAGCLTCHTCGWHRC